MDVEAARDDISVEDGSFIVYTDIFYRVKRKTSK